ncbi:MAG: branched-chain amino acid ABC transporter permease [Solirubrobacterales bacterium]
MKWLQSYGIQTLVVLAVISFPILSDSPYLQSTLIFIGIYSIVTISLCLLMGYAGQISLGHAAFFGLGAYGSGILTAKYGINPWAGMLAAAVITGFIAWIIGIPTLRLKEHFLALATLGFGVIVYICLTQLTALTGGPSGLTGIPPLSIGAFQFTTDFSYYYLVWAFVLITMFIASNIVNSRLGRALKAIHGSEAAAEAMGIDTAAVKLQIFVVSAVFASLAGSLYAHYITMINPSPFGFKMSIEFVTMAVVGGIASIWGPMLGVAAVTALTEMLREAIPAVIPSAGGEFEIVAFGLILTVIMIFMPEGLFRGVKNRVERRVKQTRRSRRESGSRSGGMEGGR